MANNPLDTNAFSHYLRFISLGKTELYQIAEPIGFDTANFVKQQEAKRYARSIEYGSIEKLTFVDAVGQYIETPQIINPQGDGSNFLDYGLQWLLSIYNDFGFESKVEYILEKNGVQFSNGMLDFTEKDITDGYTYISCKLIQKNKVADLKRRLDDKFNAFGTKNAKQETITPIATENLLMKGLLIGKKSSWDSPYAFNKDIYRTTNIYIRWNHCKEIVEDGISNTLTFLNGINFNEIANASPNDYKYLRAKKELFDIKIKINNFSWYQEILGTEGTGVQNKYIVRWGTDDSYLGEKILINEIVDRGQTRNYSLNETVDIPYLPAGAYVYIFIETYYITFEGNLFVRNISPKYTIDITTNEKSIDQVIKACRWIDLIKQASLYSCGIPVNAPLFESSGIHYNNMVFNRRMISQNTDNFYCTPKNAFESIEEVNCDYEPNETEIFIGHQGDFYTNQEVAVFQIIPSEDFTIEENDRCSINKFSYEYKTFEQDRSSENTDLAIHTSTEWLIQNENVENKKEISIEFVRDPLSIQKVVDLELLQPTTSTQEDDKVYISNVIQLAPSSFNEFGRVLLCRIIDGNLEILNRTSDGSSDVFINWLSLGFGVNATITITEGSNLGTYKVITLTRSILTLQPITATPTSQGDLFIRIKYFYTDVFWTTRTNEGFSVGTFPNQAYSIKRNMKYFSEYFSSCLLYQKKDIINSYFKSNGTYQSQLNSETTPLIENANITYDSLSLPYITPKVYKLTCYAEFQDILNYLETYKTDKGFIRTFDSNGSVIKGFVQDLDHIWSENKLSLTLEEKFETIYLVLTYLDGLLTVNDAVYDLSGVSEWWKFENDYIKLYDKNNIPLSNFYKYNLVNLNGLTFSTKEELITALLAL
mgnify:CR=1 FL=1